MKCFALGCLVLSPACAPEAGDDAIPDAGECSAVAGESLEAGVAPGVATAAGLATVGLERARRDWSASALSVGTTCVYVDPFTGSVLDYGSCGVALMDPQRDDGAYYWCKVFPDGTADCAEYAGGGTGLTDHALSNWVMDSDLALALISPPDDTESADVEVAPAAWGRANWDWSIPADLPDGRAVILVSYRDDCIDDCSRRLVSMDGCTGAIFRDESW